MPGAVSGGFLTVLMAMLFLIGIKVLLQDGLDYRKGLIAGIAFWIGIGFQNGMVFPVQVLDFAGGLFANGVISGGLAAILMTLFTALSGSRRSRMEDELDPAALPGSGSSSARSPSATVGATGWRTVSKRWEKKPCSVWSHRRAPRPNRIGGDALGW